MSRLCVLKLCPVIKNSGPLETLLSRSRLKGGDRLNSATCRSCQRGYAQRFSLLASRLYPPYRLSDRIFFNFPVILSTAKKEKYDEYGDTCDRRHKHLGILLGSLGLVVAFCDTSHFKGIRCDAIIMGDYVYVCVTQDQTTVYK